MMTKDKLGMISIVFKFVKCFIKMENLLEIMEKLTKHLNLWKIALTVLAIKENNHYWSFSYFFFFKFIKFCFVCFETLLFGASVFRVGVFVD